MAASWFPSEKCDTCDAVVLMHNGEFLELPGTPEGLDWRGKLVRVRAETTLSVHRCEPTRKD